MTGLGLKMKAVVVRTLTFALALVLFTGAHGAELVLKSTTPGSSDSHDCGCSDECACRGPVQGCNCSKTGVSLKAVCGCGCSDDLHAIGGLTWKSLLTHRCRLRAPILIWTPLFDQTLSQAWRLAFEHTHPPRVLF